MLRFLFPRCVVSVGTRQRGTRQQLAYVGRGTSYSVSGCFDVHHHARCSRLSHVRFFLPSRIACLPSPVPQWTTPNIIPATGRVVLLQAARDGLIAMPRRNLILPCPGYVDPIGGAGRAKDDNRSLSVPLLRNWLEEPYTFYTGLIVLATIARTSTRLSNRISKTERSRKHQPKEASRARHGSRASRAEEGRLSRDPPSHDFNSMETLQPYSPISP
ncbi:hypothetical protein BDP55DRAFT_435243 [Colletotrichum godetiae]|uniref:Uncharacterized protein n=1 Tax=Colletotrichum godetiae TaxID=1209918 RepID=A0AAJ0A6S7_9PEZI|nr:uncharacterized protein BDP55DRAFT_435243 [Colletotrichum godetiae]KAK1657530.1 hypothetical protein BDP55DRAFT_435243 [Colletotrichum godetiae]